MGKTLQSSIFPWNFQKFHISKKVHRRRFKIQTSKLFFFHGIFVKNFLLLNRLALDEKKKKKNRILVILFIFILVKI